MKLWSLRHPAVDRRGRCIGQTTLETMHPIAESVEVVVAYAPFVPVRLFSSDLPRCAQLAVELAAHWNIEFEITPALREMHFGEWENREYDEIDATDGLRWRAWCEDWRHLTPPGGESIDDLVNRVLSWLTSRRPSSADLLVTHAGVVRTLRVLGGESWDAAMAAQCPFLGWSEHRVLNY